MKNQNKTAQTTVSISKKYPKLGQYEELSDINLAVVAGGTIMNCGHTTIQKTSETSVKGA